MAVIQPWRDEALRPTGAPAVGWEVPAFSDALEHTAGADAVVRADTQGAILWVRSPGADRAAMVYEVPELAAATAARDTAILQARAREQAATRYLGHRGCQVAPNAIELLLAPKPACGSLGHRGAQPSDRRRGRPTRRPPLTR